MKNKKPTAVANESPTFETTLVEIDAIKSNENNPRTIKDANLKKLVKSIRQFPEMLSLRPIIVDENDVILAGNMRHKAAKEAGFTYVPVIKASSLTEEQARQFIVKDNASFGDWDFAKLFEQYTLEELEDAAIELPSLELNEEEVEDDNFEVNEEIQTSIVQGDLIEIGKHRLLCGDSTIEEHVKKVLNGTIADITFHSPPYNVGKTPNGDLQKYLNDSDNKTDNEYLELLTSTTINAINNSKFAFVNLQSIAGNKITLIEYLNQLKSFFCDYIIWDKMQAEPAMAENVLNSRFEFIYVFGHEAKRKIGTRTFRGTLENIVAIKSRQDKDFAQFHKATFPIDFAGHFVKNFSVNTCLDLFAGTGTTMIAAHKLNRIAFGVELEPKYCQIIVDRFKQLDSNIEIKINGVKV